MGGVRAARSKAAVVLTLAALLGGTAALSGAPAAVADTDTAIAGSLHVVDASTRHPVVKESTNTSGGTNWVKRIATGRFQVTFQGLGTQGGIVHVTASNAAWNTRCTAESWRKSGSSEKVYVDCFDYPGGAPLNSGFTVMFTKPLVDTTQGVVAMAYIDNPDAAEGYVPPTKYNFNSIGGRISVLFHDAHGNYGIYIPKAKATGGSVKITTVGNTTDSCRVEDWRAYSNKYIRGQVIEVGCINTAGAHVNDAFTVSYVLDNNLLGLDSFGSAYVWNEYPQSNEEYTPNPTFQYNSEGDPITILRTALGEYTVKLPGVAAADQSDVQVTTGVSGPSRCGVLDWTGDLANSEIHIECGGSPLFTVLWTGAPTP